jgi:hypothetical protein
LPVMRLAPPTYFRARFVTSNGEPILFPRLLDQSFDVDRSPIWHVGLRPPEQIDSDGTITIGPLPRGVTTLTFDTPPLAMTRLTDLQVTGAETLLDGGTVTIPDGSVLEVDVVDAAGAPVAAHEVSLEDALPLSPALVRTVRTSQQGRATFDRLGIGDFWLRASTSGPCGNTPLIVGRPIVVSSSDILRTRLVVGGSATFRVTSPFGPLRGAVVSAEPYAGPQRAPVAFRGVVGLPAFVGRAVWRASACVGSTDADGRVTLSQFPPGPARLGIRMQNSTYSVRLSVPQDGRERAITIPDGFLPVRVTNSRTKEPVAGAEIAWTAPTGRVEALASANGEALLEGVGSGAGTLAIAARGYESGAMKLSQPPAMLMEVALTPEPNDEVQPHVVTSSGLPIQDAVVELTSDLAFAVPHVAVTDAAGVARFQDVPANAFRLVARAEGFVPAVLQITSEARDRPVLTLTKGYRVVITVDAPTAAGPYSVHVLNATGDSVDDLLDGASDRSLDASGRASLGPLPQGHYVIELRAASARLRRGVEIVDRDISLVVR